ncbi:MAG TPA: tetratricopeptide repeat protein, partial [Gemmatimonadales bacterium]|nr:tetratricopeptide repeat protein [Gemmatimonadales bacterium]
LGQNLYLQESLDLPCGEPTASMSLWRRLTGKESADTPKPQRLDYLNEGLALERQGEYEAALTSYRLAYRDNPTDARILMNMAIAFTKTDRPDEAVRHYRRALEIDDTLGGAHYGLAFLLMKRNESQEAAEHLRAFLSRPPKGPDAERWVRHAEAALREIATAAAPETT